MRALGGHVGGLAAGAIESRPVRFAKGTSSATVKGSLTGDKVIDYTLRDRAARAAPARDARVTGTSYHATGQVPCSMGSAPPGSAQCDFGVIRGKPGEAEAVISGG